MYLIDPIQTTQMLKRIVEENVDVIVMSAQVAKTENEDAFISELKEQVVTLGGDPSKIYSIHDYLNAIKNNEKIPEKV